MGESGFGWQAMVSGLLGGVAGGLLVWWLALPAEVEARPDESVRAVDEAELPGELPAMGDEGTPSEDAERIERLEAHLRSLQKQVAVQATVDGREEPAADGSDEGRVTLRATDPKFQNAVRAVIDKARWEEQEARRDERDERQDKRVTRQVDELAEKLNLTDEEAQKLETALHAQTDAFHDLRASDDRPVTRNEWRTKMEELRAATRKELAGFLDAEQLEAYDKHQEDSWGRRGGRRGR